MLPRPEVKCSINVVTLMPFSRLLVGLSFKMSNMLLIKVSLFDSRGPAPKSVPVAIPVPGKKKQQKGEGRQQQRTETKKKLPKSVLACGQPKYISLLATCKNFTIFFVSFHDFFHSFVSVVFKFLCFGQIRPTHGTPCFSFNATLFSSSFVFFVFLGHEIHCVLAIQQGLGIFRHTQDNAC
jgi:hypothetical protein